MVKEHNANVLIEKVEVFFNVLPSQPSCCFVAEFPCIPGSLIRCGVQGKIILVTRETSAREPDADAFNLQLQK